jgi:hypothetical protein
MSNLIQQAAEAKYAHMKDKPEAFAYMVNTYVNEATHLLSYLSQQGDVVNPDTLPEDLVEQMTEYTSEAICEVVAKALAIGRMQRDELTKACKDLLHLNTIDMEGMTRVSPNRWYEAFNKLSDIIYP